MDKKHDSTYKEVMWKGILVRIVATVVGTVLVILVCQWFGLGVLAVGAAKRVTGQRN
jgi:hypothetical protein